MLSRIADSLFWLARYMERAEDTARILDVNYHMLLEQSAVPYRLRWDPLVVMAGEQERFSQFYEEANAQTVYEFLAFRADNPNSIVQCITKARENARTIRDRISRLPPRTIPSDFATLRSPRSAPCDCWWCAPRSPRSLFHGRYSAGSPPIRPARGFPNTRRQ